MKPISLFHFSIKYTYDTWCYKSNAEGDNFLVIAEIFNETLTNTSYFLKDKRVIFAYLYFFGVLR